MSLAPSHGHKRQGSGGITLKEGQICPIPVCYSKAGQEIYAYFNEAISVKFVIVEPFTNAMEDSRLGDNSRVFVGTVAENVEAQNIKRRANFRPFWEAMLS